MAKTTMKKASELEQGDRVVTWGGEVIVHSNEVYNAITPDGKFRRAKVLMAGGDTWDVAASSSYRVVVVKEPKKPTFWFSEVIAFNIMTFLITSLIWCLYTYKHFNVIIPVFDR